MLGAGASASAGVPLMRGFVDRARDFLALGLFSDDERPHIEATLTLYDNLKARFSITEQDLENIENLLSIADLAELLDHGELRAWLPSTIGDSVRRFIDLVIARSVRLPSPIAPAWARLDVAAPIHKRVVAALAYYGARLTVVTVNYDCILEYACHCMGLPYTYNAGYGAGVEILKLHGSSNWLRCTTAACPQREVLQIAALRFQAREEDSPGTVEPERLSCQECGSPLHSVVVPPTWGKTLEHPILHDTWTRAVQVLAAAEAFTSIGYSLPAADAKVRDLFHLGFASGRLRQAMVVIGNDDLAAERWSQLFRQFWRESRLEIRQETFEEAGPASLFASLAIPPGAIDTQKLLPPLYRAPCFNPDLASRLEAVQKGVDWAAVVGHKRQGQKVEHDSTREYHRVLTELGVLDWVPEDSILPTHGTTIPPRRPPN